MVWLLVLLALPFRFNTSRREERTEEINNQKRKKKGFYFFKINNKTSSVPTSLCAIPV